MEALALAGGMQSSEVQLRITHRIAPDPAGGYAIEVFLASDPGGVVLAHATAWARDDQAAISLANAFKQLMGEKASPLYLPN